MRKLNNSGFTLVEVLAVLVILIAIMSIAIPSISSSLERNKGKQDENKKKILESAAELYVTDHKNDFVSNEYNCVTLETLKNNGYINDEDMLDSDDNTFMGRIDCNVTTNTYTYISDASLNSSNKCV